MKILENIFLAELEAENRKLQALIRNIEDFALTASGSKADENIPDDKESAYTLGYTDALEDVLQKLGLD